MTQVKIGKIGKKKNFENVAENPEKGETVHYSSMYYGH